MDALAPYSNKLLQNGQVGVRQKKVISGTSLLTINKLLILIDQLCGRMDDDPLVVPEAVDVRARLYKDRIRQGRRQPRYIVDISRIPARQHGEPGADRGIRKKLLVHDLPQNLNRGLNHTEVPPELSGLECVRPGGLV